MPGAPAHPAPARGAPRATGCAHGPFDCEFFAVNHSIPDALAVAIRTPAGLVLHTGDIKLDQLPLDGRLTDLAGFSRLGDEGVDLFLVDSTNAEVPGFVIAEREIGPVLDGRRSTADQRGSSWPASPPTCTACSRCSTPPRRTAAGCALVGRSMVRNMGIAAELGFLNVPDGLLVELDEAMELPDERAGDRLHRVAGRAAVGAVPDGPRRPPVSARSAAGDTIILASAR